jgi:SAM-dependent methyltransferase
MDPRIHKTKIAYEAVADIFRADVEGMQFPDSAISAFIKICTERNLCQHRIVDLGSGPGTFIDHLLPAGITCIDAVDLVDSFIDHLRNKYVQYPGVRIIREDMIDYMTKQQDDTLGGIAATFSIVHIPEEFVNPLFAHMYRVLVPGGLVLLACHEGTTKGMEKELYQAQHDTRITSEVSLSCYMNYFTLEELEQSLKHAGFSVVHTLCIPSNGRPGDVEGNHLWVLAEKPQTHR